MIEVYVLEYISYFGQESELAGVYSTKEKAEKEEAKLERRMDVQYINTFKANLDEEIKIDEF